MYPLNIQSGIRTIFVALSSVLIMILPMTRPLLINASEIINWFFHVVSAPLATQRIPANHYRNMPPDASNR
jgi:hypothetical protein